MVYINCTKGLIAIFSYMYMMYLDQIQPLYYSFPFPLTLKVFLAVFIILFSHIHIKYFVHIQPLSLFHSYVFLSPKSKCWCGQDSLLGLRLLFFSINTHFLGDFIQSYGLIYHLYVENFQISLSLYTSILHMLYTHQVWVLSWNPYFISHSNVFMELFQI
jgi:hypothetical protein